MSDSKNPPAVTHTNGDTIIAQVQDATNVAIGKQINQVIGYTAEQVSLLIAQIRRADQPQTWDGRQPYVGLAAFQEADADFFFGREPLVEQLLARVAVARFVCIAGPSGSGKSSLVQAGLLPALKQGKLAGSDKWRYMTLTPRGDPIEQLGLASARLAQSPTVAQYLREQGPVDANALHQQAEILLDHYPEQRLVISVDQFEELFTQTKNEEQRRAFLALLTTAVQRADGRVIVLMAIRSDFVSQCAVYPQLRNLISQQFQLVGAMEPEELARAILLPALEVGAEVEPELVEQLINDMKGEPGALPLMQFALRNLFEAQTRQKGDVVKLTRFQYLAQGGIDRALERHADAVFAKLDADQQAIARQIFTHLIEVGQGTADTRRTASFAEVVGADVSNQNAAAVIAALADARLVTTNAPLETTDPATAAVDRRSVTIAHEKLIEAWPWLRRLVNENRDVIALQNEITGDAQEWDKSGRDASFLYTGTHLALARERLAAKQLVLGGLAQEFVDSAIQRAETERRARQRRLWSLVGGLAAAVVIFAALAFVAYVQSRLASAQSRIALARQLASQAVTVSDTEADTALLLAVEAHNRDGDLPEVRSGLLAALQCCSDPLVALLKRHEDRVWDVAFNPKLPVLASASDDGTIVIWDVQTRQPITTLVNPKSSAIIYSVAFSPDGKLLAAGDGDGVITLREVPTWRKVEPALRGHVFNVQSLKFSPDGRELVSGGADRQVVIWDVVKHQPLQKFEQKDWVWDVAFAPDGKTVAAVGKDNAVHLYTVGQTDALTTTLWFTDHHQIVTSVAFNHDPNHLLMATGDAGGNSHIIIWDMMPWQRTHDRPQSSGKLAPSLAGTVWGLDFSPVDNQVLVDGSESGSIHLWRVDTSLGITKTRLLPLSLGMTAHKRGLFGVAFSPDGKLMAAASMDGLVSLWQTDDSQSVIWHRGAVKSFTLTKAGDRLVSSSDDGGVVTWDIAHRRLDTSVQLALTDTVRVSAVSPDGSLIATDWITPAQPGRQTSDGTLLADTSAGNPIALWDAVSGKRLALLVGHISTLAALVFSPDGTLLASSDSDGQILLWDVAKHQQFALLSGHSGPVKSLAFRADGALLASGGCYTLNKTSGGVTCGRGEIRLWDIQQRRQIGAPIPSKSGFVSALAFDPATPNRLAAGHEDGTTIVFDTQNPGTFQLIGRQGPSIQALAFSPSEPLLAVGAATSEFALYDLRTGQPVGHTFREHDKWITTLAFNADGTLLFSGSWDNTIVVHDLDIRSWPARACRIANRNLTTAEWQSYVGSAASYHKTCSDLLSGE